MTLRKYSTGLQAFEYKCEMFYIVQNNIFMLSKYRLVDYMKLKENVLCCPGEIHVKNICQNLAW